MANIELIMPKMGESIMEATILNWLKQPGDAVEIDEAILEIATDKVDSEVPSPVDGIIKEILFNTSVQKPKTSRNSITVMFHFFFPIKYI